MSLFTENNIELNKHELNIHVLYFGNIHSIYSIVLFQGRKFFKKLQKISQKFSLAVLSA